MFRFLKIFKIISGPCCVVFAWWFLDIVAPTLSPELQFSLDDGGWAEFFGFLGSGIIVSAYIESWKEFKSLFSTNKLAN